ncbi:hypothetical protein NP233_g9631 [Leucocoprinus birnbaumii]|uniref:Uncharacterized protein n=1 Tax=Leucocoprinus birnbaumii TaxID=56174 RepID=A0AAD5YM20_9AGAR|nr:hypothetical protein NP233_g9631 [Leucocoprinus birnbaumii]
MQPNMSYTDHQKSGLYDKLLSWFKQFCKEEAFLLGEMVFSEDEDINATFVPHFKRDDATKQCSFPCIVYLNKQSRKELSLVFFSKVNNSINSTCITVRGNKLGMMSLPIDDKSNVTDVIALHIPSMNTLVDIVNHTKACAPTAERIDYTEFTLPENLMMGCNTHIHITFPLKYKIPRGEQLQATVATKEKKLLSKWEPTSTQENLTLHDKQGKTVLSPGLMYPPSYLNDYSDPNIFKHQQAKLVQQKLYDTDNKLSPPGKYETSFALVLWYLLMPTSSVGQFLPRI